MQLTGNEIQVLLSLRTNHYGEGDSETWSWAVNESQLPSPLTGKALSGVMASLTKKGLVYNTDVGTRDAASGLTDDGRAALNYYFAFVVDHVPGFAQWASVLA